MILLSATVKKYNAALSPGMLARLYLVRFLLPTPTNPIAFHGMLWYDV